MPSSYFTAKQLADSLLALLKISRGRAFLSPPNHPICLDCIGSLVLSQFGTRFTRGSQYIQIQREDTPF